MPVSISISLLIIILMAIATFATRVTPFLLFPGGKEIPRVILYLGKVLPPAVVGLLVVYCLKDVEFMSGSHGGAELLAVILVVVLHRWKRHNLLSIGVGTAFYMILLRIL